MINIKEFFREIDSRWKIQSTAKIPLRIIGSSALLLQTDYARGTKDSDILETADITPDIKEKLLSLAGQGTDMHKRRRLYLDIVNEAIPFLPQIPKYNSRKDINVSLKHFEIGVLDIVDIVVSKLKRFNADDVSDIKAMVDTGFVPHRKLRDRFRAALDYYSMDARAEDLPKYIRNLNTVERDFLLAPESQFDLPNWLPE